MEQETRAKLSRKRTPSECFVKYFILTPFLVQVNQDRLWLHKLVLGNRRLGLVLEQVGLHKRERILIAAQARAGLSGRPRHGRNR